MEFIPSRHLYLNDYGIVIPSVTQIIAANLGTGYDNVPESVLKAKAYYGTNIHKLIENYHKGSENKPRNSLEAATLMAYKKMEKRLPAVIFSEKMCMFEQRLAGTIDLIYADGTIGDIKTYAVLDDHVMLKLKWQLSLYYLCLYGRNGYKQVTNHMVHLPKAMNFSLVDVAMFTLDECLNFIELYESNKKGRGER